MRLTEEARKIDAMRAVKAWSIRIHGTGARHDYCAAYVAFLVNGAPRPTPPKWGSGGWQAETLKIRHQTMARLVRQAGVEPAEIEL